MHVLIIYGSPRKGNSYKIARRVAEAMEPFGEITFDQLFLRESNLKPCTGCFLCNPKGEHLCPLQDDRDSILARMDAADGVIFVSPGYVMNISSLMQGFFERLNFLCHRPRFFRQAALCIATGGGWAAKEALARLTTFAKATGFREVETLGVHLFGVPPTPEHEEKISAQILLAARHFYDAMANPRSKAPAFNEVMQFHAMRANATGGRDYFPADYAHYEQKGWLNPKVRYYTDAPVPLWKDLAARLLLNLIGRQMNKSYTYR